MPPMVFIGKSIGTVMVKTTSCFRKDNWQTASFERTQNMLIDPQSPRFLIIKIVILCAAFAGVIWAMGSLNQNPIVVQPPAAETK